MRFNGDDELIDDEADTVIEQYAAMSDSIIIYHCLGDDWKEYFASAKTTEIFAGNDKAACQQDVPNLEKCLPSTHTSSQKSMDVRTL